MATSSWKGGSGDWADASKWQGSVPDAASTDATITAADSVVTVSRYDAFTVGAVTVGATARLNVQGPRNVSQGALWTQTLSNDGTVFIDHAQASGLDVANSASGTITLGMAATLGTGSLDNRGTIMVGSGSQVSVRGVLSNSGHITVDGGSILLGTSESRLGRIDVTSGTIGFNGFFDRSLLARYAGLHDLAAILVPVDNTGQVLTASADTIVIQSESDLHGGTVINQDNRSFRQEGGTLDGVTVRGRLEIDVAATIANGLTLTGVNGTGSGRLALSQGTGVTFTGTQTLANATVDVIYPDAPDARLIVADGGRLTLASSLHFADGDRFDVVVAGSGMLVSDTVLDGSFDISGSGAFTNAGSVIASGGDVTLGATLTNLSGTTLTGGRFVAEAGSHIDLLPGARIVTLAADVTLDGSDADLRALDHVGGAEVSIGATLTAVAASGTFTLLNGRGIANDLNITIDGAVSVQGGTFADRSTTIDAGGSWTGYGALLGRRTIDNGTIHVAGGQLDVAGTLSGTGRVEIDAGATVEFQTPVAQGPVVAMIGTGATLAIDQPRRFHATVTGFGAGDTIAFHALQTDRLVFVAKSDRVFLQQGGQNLALVQLSGAYSAAGFSLTQDGNTSVITYAPPHTA